MARSELATMVEREPRFLSGVMTEGSIWWADGGEREVACDWRMARGRGLMMWTLPDWGDDGLIFRGR